MFVLYLLYVMTCNLQSEERSTNIDFGFEVVSFPSGSATYKKVRSKSLHTLYYFTTGCIEN